MELLDQDLDVAIYHVALNGVIGIPGRTHSRSLQLEDEQDILEKLTRIDWSFSKTYGRFHVFKRLEVEAFVQKVSRDIGLGLTNA